MALKNFNKVNKKAPRVNCDVYHILSINKYRKLRNGDTEKRVVDNDFYIKLKKKYPELSIYENCQIKSYIGRFNDILREHVLESRDGIILPEQSGNLFIGTYGKRTRAVDLKLSGELGKEVHYQNAHSQGYGGWVFWIYSLLKHPFTNADCWTFEPCRKFTLGLKRVYMKNWKKFIVIPHPSRTERFMQQYMRWCEEKIQQKRDEVDNKYKNINNE